MEQFLVVPNIGTVTNVGWTKLGFFNSSFQIFSSVINHSNHILFFIITKESAEIQ